MIDHVIRGISELACAYLDDHIIYSVSWEDQLVHFQAVLRSLGLMVKPCKCQLAMRECTYLGHIIEPSRYSTERAPTMPTQMLSSKYHTGRPFRQDTLRLKKGEGV